MIYLSITLEISKSGISVSEQSLSSNSRFPVFNNKSELNLQNLQVWSNFPGIKHDACMRSIKLFNDEVIPKINLDNSNIEKAS